MRLSLLAFVLVLAVPATAQPTEAACTTGDCVLRVEGGVLGPRFVQGDPGVVVSRDNLTNIFWEPGLAPLVASSPEAYEHARTYERSRAPQLIGAALSGLLLGVVAIDVMDSNGGFLTTESRAGLLVGSTVSLGVSVPFAIRGSRSRNAAIDTYNESLAGE